MKAIKDVQPIELVAQKSKVQDDKAKIKKDKEGARQIGPVDGVEKIEAEKEARDEKAGVLEEEKEVCEPTVNLGDASDPLELTKSKFLKQNPGKRHVKPN